MHVHLPLRIIRIISPATIASSNLNQDALRDPDRGRDSVYLSASRDRRRVGAQPISVRRVRSHIRSSTGRRRDGAGVKRVRANRARASVVYVIHR